MADNNLNIADSFKNIFLAGIGALSIGADKSKELINQLAARGEISVEQGRQLTEEIAHKASDTASGIHDDMLKAYVNSMKPKDRDAFVAKVTDYAAAANATSTADAAPVEVDEVVIEDVAVDEDPAATAD